MPGYLTHIIFGHKIFPNSLKNVKMFNFGLMGPDIFYYNISDPKYHIIGETLHNVDLTRLIEELQKESPEYALGLYLHSYLDMKIHPRIHIIERNTGKSHTKIETLIDAALLKKEWNTTVFRLDKHFFPNKLPARFMRIFDEVLYEYYEVEDVNIKNLYDVFLKNFFFLYKWYPIKAVASYVLYVVSMGRFNYKDYFIFRTPSLDILNDFGIETLWKESLNEIDQLLSEKFDQN
ncbi:MAG: hypothetical protein PWQ66_131 [Petrotoga sp.]|nr:hypothetical protein [Petrotoga sp.]